MTGLETSLLHNSIVAGVTQSWRSQFGKKVFFCTLLIILSILTGTLLGVYHYNFSWVNSFYWSVLTLTTVGYGDFVPDGTAQRVTGGLFVIFGTSIMALSVTQLMAILIASFQRDELIKYVTPPLTQEALDALDVSGSWAETGDVAITRDHYVRFMLIRGGFVDPEVIEDFDDSFDRLDADGNGVLTENDLNPVSDGVNHPSARKSIARAFSHVGHNVI